MYQKHIPFLHGRNLIAQNFAHLKNKRCNYKINGLMQIVELFTLHLFVYFVFLIGRRKCWENGMQSTIIHCAQSVNFYSFLYVFTFHLFSNTSKIILEFNRSWICREFQALSFDKKKCWNHMKNRGKIFKIPTV